MTTETEESTRAPADEGPINIPIDLNPLVEELEQENNGLRAENRRLRASLRTLLAQVAEQGKSIDAIAKAQNAKPQHQGRVTKPAAKKAPRARKAQ